MSSDERRPLRSSNQEDLESAPDSPSNRTSTPSAAGGIKDLFKQLDRRFSDRRITFKDPPLSHSRSSSFDHHNYVDARDSLTESAPPEWALLLIGCLLGLASGLCVAFFNKGVSFYWILIFLSWSLNLFCFVALLVANIYPNWLLCKEIDLFFLFPVLKSDFFFLG